ncbi:HAD-IC family P-type ATPase [Candidatus Stoquefichus massiliensis]|uniref:HAD-IC family P-type ATPase n=1 Tax=Candidatus Stoquefichus massiliensis TaxID=1470350 RepID=UPI00048167A7|nr:HAD-IC family P-type ATPase [Candidatus Stoquefichus massiliensis]
MDEKVKKGLTSKEVLERVEKGQVNISHDNISKTKKQIVLEHTVTYFNILNVFLAAIILSTGRWTNLTFMGVIIMNSLIGIYQELKVKKIIDQLTVVTVKKIMVIRDYQEIMIPIEKLVLDDIVFLESGNQIGTDCVTISSQGMEVNESMLTGESKPVKKKVGDELLSGSFVVAGSAYGRVIRVGNDNYSTQLVHKAKHKNKASSEMKDAIEKVIKILSFVIIPVGLVLFMSQLSASPHDHATAIVKTVAGVIGMIPEGLVLLTSLSFILGVGKLAKRKALIQEMEAIEALARVDVLCLDKTGTITTGELEVEKVDFIHDYSSEVVHQVMGLMAYGFDDINATQKALRAYFKKFDDISIIGRIPFSSQRKMRALALKNGQKYVLGAPEYLVDENDPLLQRVNDYSRQGLRVLLLGETDFLDDEKNDIGDVKTMALIVIHDCIRLEAKDTLQFFEKAAVNICILSGDNPMTVSRVAQLAGLQGGEKYIDASTLPEDDEELQKVVSHYRVYGRVKPEQKQQIIKAFQTQGHVVGMVGDGVNDVLALKDADCGIAMAAGSDAAKQAAHIVLLDSNFASMQAIVREGRAIIADIERVSSLYLTKTIYSTVLCLVFAALQMSYPFTPLQLSLISGLAIGVPSFLITLERSSTLSAQGFLRHVISTAVPCAVTMIIYMLFVAVLGQWLHFDMKTYSTYYFLVAGFISFLVVFIVCMPLNRLRVIVATLMTVLFYLILLIMPEFFGIYSIINWRFIWILPICISSIFVIGALKRLIHKLYQIHERRLSSQSKIIH